MSNVTIVSLIVAAIKNNEKFLNKLPLKAKNLNKATLDMQVALAQTLVTTFENMNLPSALNEEELNKLKGGRGDFVKVVQMVRERKGLGVVEARDLVASEVVRMGLASFDADGKSLNWF